MSTKIFLTALCLAGLTSFGSAQDASVQKTYAPLNINNHTISELRMHQIGSILLPEGKPPFPAVVVMHGCNGVTQSTRVWARRLASWGYAALDHRQLHTRGLENVCEVSANSLA